MPHKDKELRRQYMRAYKKRERDHLLARRRQIYTERFRRPRKGVWAKGHSNYRLCLSCGGLADIKPKEGCIAPQHQDRWDKRKAKNEEYRKSRRDAARMRGEVYRNYDPDKRRRYEREKMRSRTNTIRLRLGGICSVCGFSDKRVLQVHHRNGGGGKHRKKIGWQYKVSLLRLSAEELKREFELLCANCHSIQTHKTSEASVK